MVQVAGSPRQQASTPEEWFEAHSRNVKSARISHALLTPGVTFEQALAKATIKDDKELNGFVFLIGELRLNDCTLMAETPLCIVPHMVLDRLIGSNSIKGKARLEALEADIAIIDQAAHQTHLTGKAASLDLKSKRGLFNKRDKEERADGS